MPDDGAGSRRWLRPIAFGPVALLAIVVVGYLVASYAVYDTLAAVPPGCPLEHADQTPQQFDVDGMDEETVARYRMPVPEEVELRSRDANVPDLVLRGWWVPGERADAPAVILVHGWRTCRRDDNVLLPAGMLHRAGFGVLLMDQREHGDSDVEDGRFAGGVEEHLDVLGAWDWLRARGVPEDRIGLMGMSFGAATVVIAGGTEPRVAAVWEDSSFGDIAGSSRAFLAYKGYPELLAAGALLMARLVAGDDIDATGPLEVMPAYADRPLAIVHGAADEFIPWPFAEQLRDAAAAQGVDLREYWIVPEAGHARSVITDPSGYERRLVAFFEGALGEP